MNERLHKSCSSKVAECLLELRRNLANSDFLQKHFYKLDESKFVDSTYVYWIRLHCEHEKVKGIDVFPEDIPSEIKEELEFKIRRRIFKRLPDVYSSLIKLSSKTKPELSVQECLAQRDERIRYELPTCIPYAIFFSEINRLVRGFDADRVTAPNSMEFDALFDRLSRNALKQGRSRFPEMWDEVKGHYVLDSRGTIFGKRFAIGLKERGYLLDGSQFIDLGSGVGTMVAAVNRYTDAHATGVERHSGVMRLAKTMVRRLCLKRCLRTSRIEFIQGDFFLPQTLDLARYDVLYVYSPIGRWEIDIDQVIGVMRTGAILAMNKTPHRNLRVMEHLGPIAGLNCYRKISEV